MDWKRLRTFVFEDAAGSSLPETTTKWNQPFPLEIPFYPVEAPKDHSTSTQILDPSLCIRDAFVPSHLPLYPPTHTYRKTKIQPGDIVKVESKKRSHGDGSSDINKERRKMLKNSSIQSVQNSLTLIEDSIDNIEQS